jgi:hypothetical protein
MTRRIKRELQKFFEEMPLTPQEQYFILGCIKAQERYPQLTSKQWKIVCDLEEKYKNGKSE